MKSRNFRITFRVVDSLGFTIHEGETFTEAMVVQEKNPGSVAQQVTVKNIPPR